MTDFAARKCKPCEGGVEPFSPDQAKEALRALHADWKLSGDGKSIARTFDFPAFGRTMAFANAVVRYDTTHRP